MAADAAQLPPDLDACRRQLLAEAVRCQALQFGEFKLKSGRISPYFFNAGLLADGRAITRCAMACAALIRQQALHVDVLFGPAYKGIWLACATATALLEQHDINCGVAYNRKEAKQHGETGELVGAPLAGRVLLIDDVMTSGLAVRGALPYISQAGGQLVAVLTLLDRQERGQDQTVASTADALAGELGVPVLSVLGLDHLLDWLQAKGQDEHLARIREYRRNYGAPPPA